MSEEEQIFVEIGVAVRQFAERRTGKVLDDLDAVVTHFRAEQYGRVQVETKFFDLGKGAGVWNAARDRAWQLAARLGVPVRIFGASTQKWLDMRGLTL